MTYIKSQLDVNRPWGRRGRVGGRASVTCCALILVMGMMVGCDGLPSIVEPSEEPGASEDDAEGDDQATEDDQKLLPVEPMQRTARLAPIDGESDRARLRIDAPVALNSIDVTVGAPGLWPPREVEASTNTSLVLPATRAEPYGDRTLTHYEIRAVGTAADKTYAYWGDVSFGEEAEERTIELEPADELTVAIENESEEPVAGATVRLSRGLVGLVNLAETSRGDGTADFAGIPSGDYRLTVEADGYVRNIRHVLRAGTERQTARVSLERGSVVRGYVRDVHGRPIVGAEVAIYPESPFADTQVDTSLLAELGVWSQIAVTDLDGHYVARGIGADAVRVGAGAPGFAPTLGELVRFGEADAANVDLVLREGRGLRVEVVDETGEPVPEATVSWESLEDHGGRSASTNRDGLAIFASVPEDAFVMARLGAWSSRRRNVPPLKEGESNEIQLTLRKPVVENRIDVRFTQPPGVYIDSATLEMESGEVCPPEESDAQVWSFVGCKPGQGTLEVETRARGTHAFEQEFEDANELGLPELVEAKVILEGLVGREWNDVSLGWRWPAQEWRGAQFADERTSEKRIWKRSLLPGRYELLFEHPATGEQRFDFRLESESASHTWRLERRATIPIYVTDAQGMPVDNALVQVWKDGELLREGYSRGAESLSFRLTPPLDARIFAIDARRGEASRTLQLRPDDDAEDVILRLDDPLLTHDLPPGRLTDTERISEILGVPLVQDGDSWLLDATEPASAAVKAGLERGDRLLWVREVEGGYRVAVERGRDIIEVTVS
ncbi:MAG: carboxypeptidase regulatory-like domain-containing protein [Myxococcota bacterium]